MTKDLESEKLKKEVIKKAKLFGADLIGIAPVERWVQNNETKPPYYPQTIFPFSKSVIVLGIQIFLPMIETTPSIIYSELYNTTNRILDDIAYKLSSYINSRGCKAVFFPRDAYGDISVLVKNPEAAFSHVIAAKYAGLGTIGYNHTLLTREFGSRVRLVSVFTDAILPSDNMLEKELCIQCELCKKNCPTQAFTTTDNFIADMDKVKCALYHEQLKKEYCYPCGICIKVCPIGNDRKQYGKNSPK